jgi:hypothetical protein
MISGSVTMSTNKLSVSQTIYISKVRQHASKSFPEFNNSVYINGETGDILYIKESPSTKKKKYYTVQETGLYIFKYNRVRDSKEIERLISLCVPENI